MSQSLSQCVIKLHEEHHALEDYQGGVPRWCSGCGDNAILAAMQRLCSEENLAPENTVFVSGIGCSSRLPHYMKTYGFHGIHGRAFPVAEGVKMARPDLNVFVSTGDGDCCSIGAAHWIHANRYNMNLTVVLHDNHVYGLTKKQASPTSPRGLKSNTPGRGRRVGRRRRSWCGLAGWPARSRTAPTHPHRPVLRRPGLETGPDRRRGATPRSSCIPGAR